MTLAKLRALHAKAQNPTTEGVCETWYHPDMVDAMRAAYDALPALLDVVEAAAAHLRSTNAHPHSDEWIALSEATLIVQFKRISIG